MSAAAPDYVTLDHLATAEIEVKRSRFRAEIWPITTENEARTLLSTARTTYWDARHHCSAFKIGVAGIEPVISRSNDDGEPAGTAGRPILDALQHPSHPDLTNVAAIVTRWFGGTLLGTGGLIRAYGDAVRAALATAHYVRYVRGQNFTLTCGYEYAPKAEHALHRAGAQNICATYGPAQVHLTWDEIRAPKNANQIENQPDSRFSGLIASVVGTPDIQAGEPLWIKCTN